MKEYIALKKFHCGELTKDILENERFQFDGYNAVIRGQKVQAPSLMACWRSGWIKEAVTDASGKLVETSGTPNMETPQQRAARMKAERKLAVMGSPGSGEFLADHVAKLKKGHKVKKQPEIHKDTVIQSHTADVQTNLDKRTAKKAEAAEKAKAKADKKGKPLEVVKESEGVEIGKVKMAFGVLKEEEDPKSFYEAMKEGSVKKLEITQDQFVPKVRVIESMDEAIEIKKLVSSSEIAVTKDPLKNWSSMTATKKENFIKKATDVSVVEQILSRETGTVKRKAAERLNALKR